MHLESGRGLYTVQAGTAKQVQEDIANHECGRGNQRREAACNVYKWVRRRTTKSMGCFWLSWMRKAMRLRNVKSVYIFHDTCRPGPQPAAHRVLQTAHTFRRVLTIGCLHVSGRNFASKSHSLERRSMHSVASIVARYQHARQASCGVDEDYTGCY